MGMIWLPVICHVVVEDDKVAQFTGGLDWLALSIPLYLHHKVSLEILSLGGT